MNGQPEIPNFQIFSGLTCTVYIGIGYGAELCGKPVIAVIFDDYGGPDYGDPKISGICRECYLASLKSKDDLDAIPIESILVAADQIRAHGWKKPRGRKA